MKCYMGCEVYLEYTGRGSNYKKRWVIRDSEWGNKLVASFTEAQFFGKDARGNNLVDEDQIIRDWCDKKKTDPAWLAYKHNKEVEAALKNLVD